MILVQELLFSDQKSLLSRPLHQQVGEDSEGRDDRMISRTGNDSNGRGKGCPRTLPSDRIFYCCLLLLIIIFFNQVPDCLRLCVAFVFHGYATRRRRIRR